MEKMLIVDDDWMITDSLCQMDEWVDMQIDVVGTAENGKEALFWMEKERIDIILTDIRMPEMDGLSLTKEVSEEKNYQTNIIIMSGYEDFNYARKALHYGVKGYLLKPIDCMELFDLIEKIKEEKSARKAPEDTLKDNGSQSYHERIITSTLNYIHSNYMDPLSLRELAARVHLSDHYLGQLFKSVTGESFLKYVTKVRMEMAVTFLKNPVLKIYEISEKVGYTDHKHFIKVFKKTYQCTPKHYRQKLLNKNEEELYD